MIPRVGPLIIETQQNFDGEAAFGHFSLVSSGESVRETSSNASDFGLQYGLTVPDVYLSLQGRWNICEQWRCRNHSRRTAIIDVRYGKPATGDNVNQFVNTMQVGVELEFEKVLHPSFDWLTSYAAFGVGWRREQLTGKGVLSGQQSDSVDRVGLIGDAGFRFGTSAQFSS